MTNYEWQILDETLASSASDWPFELERCEGQFVYIITAEHKISDGSKALLDLSAVDCLSDVTLRNVAEVDEVVIQLPNKPMQLNGNLVVSDGKSARVTFVSDNDLYVYNLTANNISDLRYIMGQCNMLQLEDCTPSAAKLWLNGVLGQQLNVQTAKLYLGEKLSFPLGVLINIYHHDNYEQQFVLDSQQLAQLDTNSLNITSSNISSLGINLFGAIIGQKVCIDSQSYIWFVGKILGQDMQFTAKNIRLHSGSALQTVAITNLDSVYEAQKLRFTAKHKLLCETGANLFAANGLSLEATDEIAYYCYAESTAGNIDVRAGRQGAILKGKYIVPQGSFSCIASGQIDFSGECYAAVQLLLQSGEIININKIDSTSARLQGDIKLSLQAKDINIQQGSVLKSISGSLNCNAQEKIKLEESNLCAQDGIILSVQNQEIGSMEIINTNVTSHNHLTQIGRVPVTVSNSLLVGKNGINLRSLCLETDAKTSIFSDQGKVKINLADCNFENKGLIGSNNRLEIQIDKGGLTNRGMFSGGASIDFKILRSGLSNYNKIYSNGKVRFGIGYSQTLYFGEGSYTQVGTYEMASFADNIWKIEQIICHGCSFIKTNAEPAVLKFVSGIVEVAHYHKETKFIGEKSFVYAVDCTEDSFLFWSDSTCYQRHVTVQAFEESHEHHGRSHWQNAGSVFADGHHLIIDVSNFIVDDAFTSSGSVEAKSRETQRYIDMQTSYFTNMLTASTIQQSTQLTETMSKGGGTQRFFERTDVLAHGFSYNKAGTDSTELPLGAANVQRVEPQAVPVISTNDLICVGG